MQMRIFKSDFSFWLGMVLTLPTTFVIIASLLKYGLGLPLLFDAIEPYMNRFGAQQPLGFNINALILLGPVAALLLNAAAVLQVHIASNDIHLQFHISIEKKWRHWMVVIGSAMLLLILFLYAVGENCSC